MKKRLENSTLSGKTSAMNYFRKFLAKTKLKPMDFLREEPSGSWSSEVKGRHLALMIGFMTFATRSHKTAKTCITYARDVHDCWKRSSGYDLWTDEQRKSLSGFEHGLAKLKSHVVNKKLGLSAPDVLALCNMTESWCKSFTLVDKFKRDLWEERLGSCSQAQWKFAYGVTYRFGETASPQVDDFDPLVRLTRNDFRVSCDKNGVRRAHISQPQHKCAVKGKYEDLSCTFDYSDPLNWAVAIERMLLADPVASEHRAITPLFRDSRMCPPIGRGFYQHGGKILSPRWHLRIIRKIIDLLPDHFGERKSKMFGLHSFRIGKTGDLIDAGADVFTISSLGRWVSDVVLKYHRLTPEQEFQWHKKAATQALDKQALSKY